jgi:hypothetical protein
MAGIKAESAEERIVSIVGAAFYIYGERGEFDIVNCPGLTTEVTTQIQLTEEQADKIRQAAIERNCSVAELIRQAIDLTERRRRALDIAGKFSSGRKDISSKHDEYLADAFGK